VDDEGNNLVSFRSYFRKQYEVFTAQSATEAFEILGQQQIPIIISDQRMPGTSGVEFLEQSIKEHPDSIRVIITAHTDIQMVIDSINRSQITKFIQKPWDWEKLSMAIENCALLYQSKLELKQKNTELAKANDELNKFVYSISHDLRSPLMSILGIVHLSKNTEDKTENQQYLEMIEKCVLKLDLFIKNMIDYYKNSRGEEQAVSVDFKELCKNVVEVLQNQDPGMTFELETTQPSEFYADNIRLQVILNNLVSNAIKYQNPGAEKRFVKLQVTSDNHSAVIRVIDNGIGIMKEHLESIFKLFFRTENTRDKDGTGIGLYIVKESVEKIGGSIKVESVPMEGTSFEIIIPNKKQKL
jgi:signal transduction histidine kinase